MSYMVYHASYLPEYLKDEQEYLEHLATGEWFDRPQKNQRGNRDETERLLNEYKERTKPEHIRLSEHAGKILQYTDDKERIHAEHSINGNYGTNESSACSWQQEKIIKRRGRPKKNHIAD